MRSPSSRVLFLASSLFFALTACGDDGGTSAPPGGTAGSSTGGSSAGGTNNGGGKAGTSAVGGSSGVGGTGGSAGSTAAGAAGSTAAGAAGSNAAGAAGQPAAGAAGQPTAGAAGSSAAGAAGSSAAGAGGEASAGAAGTTAAGAGGDAGAAGEAGAGGQATAGAGGDAGSAGAAGQACETVTLSDAQALFGEFFDVSARASALGNAGADFVRVHFDTLPIKTTYQLTTAPNAVAVPQLVFVAQDVDPQTGLGQAEFASVAGSVTVTEIVTKSQTKGSLANVELREITVDDNGKATPVAGGRCLLIAAATWDTTLSCYDATHCSVGSSCDPDTRQCSAQCSGGSPVACQADEYCGLQPAAGGGFVGACYRTCSSSVGGTCNGGTQTCSSKSVDGSGYCLGVQQAPVLEGNTCTGRSATFETCELGSTCVDDDLANASTYVCRKTCKPLAGGCPGGQICDLDGACRASPRRFDTQAGQSVSCASGKTSCLIEGGAAKGRCDGGAGCSRVVFSQAECPVGTTFLTSADGGGICF